ncbi:alpha/beta hydrolase fold domain-containing protein [Sinomonas atrocyanea]
MPAAVTLPTSPGTGQPFVEMFTDMVYRQFDHGRPLPGGQQLRFDFLRPSSQEPTPLVIFIKGGGFRNIHKSRYLPQLLDLAQAGVAVASVEYRTSNVAAFPAQLHDVKAAVRYFRSHAAEWNLDGDAFAVWGNSAGGTLATLLGATNGDRASEGEGEHPEHSSRVSAVATWYGVTDALAMPNTDMPGSPMSQLFGVPTLQDSEQARTLTPARYIGPDTPPFLIMHGDRDATVPCRQSELLAAALAERGVPFKFYRLEGAGHSFEQFTSNSQALEITRSFLLGNLNRHPKR